MNGLYWILIPGYRGAAGLLVGGTVYDLVEASHLRPETPNQSRQVPLRTAIPMAVLQTDNICVHARVHISTSLCNAARIISYLQREVYVLHRQVNSVLFKLTQPHSMPNILGMVSLTEIGGHIASARRQNGLTQLELATRAGVSRPTIDLLENGRATEIGYSKLTRILAVLGLEFRLQPVSPQRPTLEDLLKEESER